MVGDRATSLKINYVAQVKEILNLKGNLNCIIGSKVTANLLEGLILPIGGVASGRDCACSLHSRLVFVHFTRALEILSNLNLWRIRVKSCSP